MDEGFHLGSYLTKLIEVKKLKRSDITRAMGVQYSAFYGYENRPSLQYAIIMRLCHAMKYNLFLDIAGTLPSDYQHNKVASSESDSRIAALEEENKKLKWENDLLKEMMIKKG